MEPRDFTARQINSTTAAAFAASSNMVWNREVSHQRLQTMGYVSARRAREDMEREERLAAEAPAGGEEPATRKPQPTIPPNIVVWVDRDHDHVRGAIHMFEDSGLKVFESTTELSALRFIEANATTICTVITNM